MRIRLYSRLCAPVSFADGAPSAYGFGLNRAHRAGRAVTAHGGALRGWRSHRLYVPSERVSVVVMFNHLSDAHEAAVDCSPPCWARSGATTSRARPAARLARRLHRPGDRALGAHRHGGGRRCSLRFGHFPEQLDLQADGSANGHGVRLRTAMTGCGWSGRWRTTARVCDPATTPRRRRTLPAAIVAKNWMPS